MLDDFFFGHRNDETFKVELLTPQEVSLGSLGRMTKGKLDFNLYRTIRGGGNMTLTLAQPVEWLSARLKISYGFTASDGIYREWGLGVFRPLVGDENWNAVGASGSVALLDKTSFLDEWQIEESYSLAIDTVVTSAVVDLLVMAGEANIAVTESGDTLRTAMSWPPGTSLLRIINDLLSAINYFALWVDGDGQFRAESYRRPSDRPMVHRFVDDPHQGIYLPEFDILQEPYNVPNKIIGWSRAQGENDPLVSVITNEDPNSPYSFDRRGGKWKTETLPDLDVTTQEALDDQVYRALLNRTALARSVKHRHAWIPMNLNDVFGWANSRAGLDILTTLVSWEMELVTGQLVSAQLSEVVKL